MTRKRKSTRGKRKSGSLKTALLGLAALRRMPMPLWAKIALGLVALGSIGYTSGLSGKMGIDQMLRRKQTV